MKFVEVKETEVEDAEFELSINFKSEEGYMNLSYTCPKCAGYGCNTHVRTNDECGGGTVVKNVTKETFKKVFNDSQQKIIYKAIKLLIPTHSSKYPVTV
jgi:predicted nucleic acid binding AN1-type Zn finger protein